MNKKKWFLTTIFIILIFFIVLHFGLIINRGKNDIQTPLSAEDIFRTALPKYNDFIKTRTWYGTVFNTNKVYIVALTEGKITSVETDNGSTVKRGDLLFTIGGSLVNNRLEILSSKLSSIKKRLSLAQRTFNLKNRAYKLKLAKHEELYAAGNELAKIQFEKTSCEKEKEMFENAITVRSTINGVFTNRTVSVGQVVEKGYHLAEILPQKTFRIKAAIFLEKEKESELKGKEVLIKPNNVSANISTILPRRNSVGGTEFLIDSPKLYEVFRPGETVSGVVLLSKHLHTLSVPRSAIVRNENKASFLFVRDASGFHKKSIETGMSCKGWVEIKTGITENDQIVISGAYELFYRNFSNIYKVVD